MALAIAYEDVKANQFKGKEDGIDMIGGITVMTPFFGSNKHPTSGLPHATLALWDPGRLSRAHFHVNDQFQVLVDGKGKLGRHDLTPYSVHFSRAYTPYGPLSSDASTRMTLFVMRAHHDPGSQRLPQELDQLKQVPDRQPWQVTSQVTFPKFQPGTADVILQEIPNIKDEQGLAGYTLSMKPNTKTYAPDPSHGDGQYVVVVKGSLLHDNKEHKAYALVFIFPKESPFEIHAGLAGLEALVLNFPRPQTRSMAATKRIQASTGFKTWQCALCSFVYDEAAGLPEEGVAPGTRWTDVPETWSCPDCSASKTDFEMIEL